MISRPITFPSRTLISVGVGLVCLSAAVVIGGAVGSPVASAGDVPCVGDCDNSGRVSVGECLIGVNILLDRDSVDHCTAIDSNNDQKVDVGEVTTCVNNLLHDCGPTPTPPLPTPTPRQMLPTPTPILVGPESVRASSRVALQTAKHIGIMDFGVAANPPSHRSESTVFRLAARPRRAVMPAAVGGANGLPACAETRCEVTGQTSTMTVIYHQCTSTTPGGHTVTRDGMVEQTVNNPDFCVTQSVGLQDKVTLRLTQFTQIEDVQGTSLAEYTATVVDSFSPTHEGCAADQEMMALEPTLDGVEKIDGSLTFKCSIDAETFSCPQSGMDTTVTARNVTFTRTSGGFPCQLGIAAQGELEIDDRLANEHFTETFGQFQFTETIGAEQASVITVDGDTAVDCLGSLQFETRKPEKNPETNEEVRYDLIFPVAADCPVNGELKVTEPHSLPTSAQVSGAAFWSSADASDGGASGSPGTVDTVYRDRLFRAANGQVYQVLQNPGSDEAFGTDAIQVTSVAGSFGSVANCANSAGATSRPEAVVGAEHDTAFPPTSVFKSPLIPDATFPCFNRNGGGAGHLGDGQVCIGPGCADDCTCGGADCSVFTIADGTVITDLSPNVPAATLVDSLAALGDPCSGLAGRSTYRFGSSGPTTEVAQCDPAPTDGFKLPSFPSGGFSGGVLGTTVIFAYDTPLVSPFQAGSAGFPIDVDGQNIIGCEGSNRVLHFGRSTFNPVAPPRIVYTPMGGVAFDFDGDDIIDSTQATCRSTALSRCNP